MGRKKTTRLLDVYIGSTQVGTYSQLGDGSTTFRYQNLWLNSENNFPISHSIPLSNRTWSGLIVENFFSGLLPDEREIRETIAAREQTSSANVFDLLSAIGRDCVGSLQFLPSGKKLEKPSMQFAPISDDEIAQKLETLGIIPLGNDSGNDFRISIAGVQKKTAFLKVDGKWCIPIGSTPTSHIFKPAISNKHRGADLSNSPWNEWISLSICEAFGLPSAKTEVQFFNEKPVLIIERFDRKWVDNVLYRVPQEDICQALGISSTKKYQSDGGPSVVDVMNFLNSSISPMENRRRFMKLQIVFWLLCAIDGHAKNFSVFQKPSGFELTPFYDVMSVSPYPEFPIQKTKMAMSLGNNNHYGIQQIQPRHFYQTAKQCKLSNEVMDELFHEVISNVETVIETCSKKTDKSQAPVSEIEPIFEALERRARILDRSSSFS